MNENHLKIVVPIVLLLPVALLVVFMMRGQIPENHPLMTIVTSNVDGVKVVEMTDEAFRDFGSSEAAFLIARMFNDPTEYKFFPLAQKKGELHLVSSSLNNFFDPVISAILWTSSRASLKERVVGGFSDRPTSVLRRRVASFKGTIWPVVKRFFAFFMKFGGM